jgi:hypothetical protein
MTYDDSSDVAAVMLGVAHRSTAAAVVLVTAAAAAAAAAAESLFTLHAMSVKTPWLNPSATDPQHQETHSANLKASIFFSNFSHFLTQVPWVVAVSADGLWAW